MGDERWPLDRAATCVLPASLGEITFSGEGELLIGYLPDLQHEVIAPLEAQGYDRQAISRLGDVWDEKR